MHSSASLNKLNVLARFIEDIAAWFLGAVTALTFVSVILRYFFSWAIPDTFDMTSQLLAILIFWGLAGTGFRGDHITVDLLYGLVSKKIKKIMDIFADVITCFAMLMLTVMVYVKVMDTRADNVLTFDLNQPVWIYYLIAWLGLLSATVLTLARVYWLIADPVKVAREDNQMPIE